MKSEELVAGFVALVRQAVAAELDARAAAAAPAERSLTTAEAAAFLAYDPTYVIRLAKSGDLASTGEGRGRRYLMADLESYRAKHRTAARGINPRKLDTRLMEDPAPAASGAPSHY